MKKIVLIASVIFVSASMNAIDIYTRTPKQKKSVFKSETKEVTVEEAPKYVVPRPDKTICPVTGVPIDVDDNTPTSSYQNKNYYFLNESVKAQFDKDPFNYAKLIETCDICGKQEKKTRGRSSFLDFKYNGVIYHFDTVLHREEFKADPAKYIIGKENYGSKQKGKKKLKPKTLPVKPKEAVSPDIKNVPPVLKEQEEATEEETEVQEVVIPESEPVVAPAPDVSREEKIEEKTKE
ncbi:MAG: hypothetical protein V1752_07800 [Candidatus Firestonebacteria bacterium]